MSGSAIDTVLLTSIDLPILLFVFLELLKSFDKLHEAQPDMNALHVLQILIKIQFFRVARLVMVSGMIFRTSEIFGASAGFSRL
jgi:hypothetical protein